MPVKTCQLDNKPGFKWGDKGKCFTYGSDAGKQGAKDKAQAQGAAIEINKAIEDADYDVDETAFTDSWYD